MTKLSIITINRNNAVGLRRTIESVVSQSFTDFEYIIIDGASTDESVEVIREFENLKIWEVKYAETLTIGSRLQWVSEPDKGIYNAMNKGILKAKGEYLLMLNSGDWLVDEGVVGDFCATDFNEDIVLGNMYLWDNGKVTLQQTKSSAEFGFEHFYFGGSLPHQATFTKRKLFDLYGLYNENYKIASDFEFFVIALLTKGVLYGHFDRIISYYDLSGFSSQTANDELHQAERLDVFQKHVPLMYKSYKKACDTNDKIDYYEFYFREYMNLKNGKLGIIIRLMLFLKKRLKNVGK